MRIESDDFYIDFSVNDRFVDLMRKGQVKMCGTIMEGNFEPVRNFTMSRNDMTQIVKLMDQLTIYFKK